MKDFARQVLKLAEEHNLKCFLMYSDGEHLGAVKFQFNVHELIAGLETMKLQIIQNMLEEDPEKEAEEPLKKTRFDA